MNKLKQILPLSFIIMPILLYLWFINKYGVNFPFLDDWTGIVPLVKEFYIKKLTIESLWSQHTENRMFFPNIFYILVAYFTQLNIKVLMYFSFLFLIGSCFLIFLFYKKKFNNLWFFIPISFLLFSLIQWGDTLWGFELAWYMVLFFTLLSFYFLEKVQKSFIYLILSLISGTVASYSSVQGLIVWPVGLFFIIFMIIKDKNFFWSKVFYCWLLSAITVFFIFLIGFNFNNGAIGGIKKLFYFLYNSKNSIIFIFNSLGGIIPPLGFFNIIIGIIVFLYIVYIIYIFLKLETEEQKDTIIYIMLILFGLMFDIFILIGRSHFGPYKSLTTTYTLYYLVLFIGIYLFLLSISHNNKNNRLYNNLNKFLLGVFFIIFLFQVPTSIRYGVIHGNIHRFYTNADKNLVLFYNYHENPNLRLENKILPFIYQTFPTQTFLKDIIFLKNYRLNVFSKPYSSKLYDYYLNLSDKYPEYRNSLNTLFYLYITREDLQDAFHVSDPKFEENLINWACNSAKTSPQLASYAKQYKELKMLVKSKNSVYDTVKFF